MIASLKPLAKTSRSLHACLLACVLALVPTSPLLASDVLADCLEPECIEALNFHTELHRIFRASDEPVLHFLANKNAASAATILANPPALGDNWLLVLFAIYETATPTPEQRAAVRAVATDHAFLQLALLPSASTPEEADLILKDALAATNWSEGYIETLRLVHREMAELDAETIFPLLDPESAELWSIANAKNKKITAQNLFHGIAFSVAAAQTPAYQGITSVCRELRLIETIHRRTLCKALGQQMERQSNTQITVLIGLSIQKNAAETTAELAQIATRKTAWNELSTRVFDHISQPYYDGMSDIERAKIDVKIAKQFLADEEVPALIKLYEQHPQADEAVLALIRAVRAKR